MKLWFALLIPLLTASPASALVLSGEIRWQGEVEFAESVVIPAGASLTIAAHSRIRFAAGGLEVAGRLLAEQVEFSGRDWDGLVLKNCDATTRLRGVTVRGAKTGLLVQGGAPELVELTLRENQVGLELRGKAAGSLRASHFADNAKVGLFVKDESTTRILDCRFDGNGKFGAYLYRARPDEFAGNRFAGNGTGLMIAYHGSDPLVAGNLFVDNETAIQVDRAARPELRGNRLLGNRTGIHLYRRADPLVTGNLLAGNQVAILIAYSSYPQIVSNDFRDNPLAIRLEYQSSAWEQTKGAAARSSELATRGAFGGQGQRTVGEEQRRAQNLEGLVVATGNWWGEAGTRELESAGFAGNPAFIHDGRDQPTFHEGGADYPLDRVRFEPWSRTPLTELLP
ncbi:MAG: right-handed parallel beta-helix repeat-containing protein [Desulfuromonadales bacterium]|nr:right-handed parallel beta-helix repeat-containing protein [Desulfuromonadales bacterium]